MSRSITDFFKPSRTNQERGSALPHGYVRSAIKETKKVEEDAERIGSKRGDYAVISAENKARIARYASENGVTASLRHFKRSGEFKDLKEATVRGWVKRFKSELSSLGTASSSTDISELNEKKRGRPLLVGEDVESYVKQFLRGVRDRGGVVNTTITLAAAKDIILAKDSNLLTENGGHIDVTKE